MCLGSTVPGRRAARGGAPRAPGAAVRPVGLGRVPMAKTGLESGAEVSSSPELGVKPAGAEKGCVFPPVTWSSHDPSGAVRMGEGLRQEYSRSAWGESGN